MLQQLTALSIFFVHSDALLHNANFKRSNLSKRLNPVMQCTFSIISPYVPLYKHLVELP